MGLTFRSFIHPSLRDAYDRMAFTHKLIFLVRGLISHLLRWRFSLTVASYHPLLSLIPLCVVLKQVVHGIDRIRIWHRLPVLLGLLYLEGRRILHQKYNLLNVGKIDTTTFDPDEYPNRTDDGQYNDPNNASAGSQMTFIGRNGPPQDQKDQLMDPDPFLVARKLLDRRDFKDAGKQLNMIACSWIQFMIHDWIEHLEDTRQGWKHHLWEQQE